MYVMKVCNATGSDHYRSDSVLPQCQFFSYRGIMNSSVLGRRGIILQQVIGIAASCTA